MSQAKRKVKFRCRDTKSHSCSKLNPQQIAHFKATKILMNKCLPLKGPPKLQRINSQAREQPPCPNIPSHHIYFHDSEAYQEFLKDCDSKATEKKERFMSGNLRQSLERLQAGQEKIISMLQMLQGLNDQRYPSVSVQKEQEEVGNTNENAKFFRRNKFSITNVINQNIAGSSIGSKETRQEKFYQKRSRNPSVLRKRGTTESKEIKDIDPLSGKMSPLLARMLLEALMEDPKPKKTKNGPLDLKRLLSLRFYAQNLSFSDCLEQLLDFQEQLTEADVFRYFSHRPWFLNNEQTRELLLACYHCPTTSYRVEVLAQKVRCFIEDFPKSSIADRQKKISQIQRVFTNRKDQLLKMIRRHAFEQPNIHIEQLEDALREFRLNHEQIWLVLGNVCLYVQSLYQIPFESLLNQNWIKSLS